MEKFKNEKFSFCNTLGMFMLLLTQNKKKIHTEMYKCTRRPSKSVTWDFFKTRHFPDPYSVYFYSSVNYCCSEEVTRIHASDILCKSKKEYINIVGWGFFVVLFWFFFKLITVLQSYLPGLSTSRTH